MPEANEPPEEKPEQEPETPGAANDEPPQGRGRMPGWAKKTARALGGVAIGEGIKRGAGKAWEYLNEYLL